MGHVWVRVNVNGETKDKCAGGRRFEPLTEVRRLSGIGNLTMRLMMVLYAQSLVWMNRVPEWAERDFR
ncbi:hypothetical protein CKALI_11835 [Corynebacterium kalinowskii]|uniref:Uncharacterized protein n=1 Tax=Corynebacterium kalinowskii TaxID=2675216 RepID=A0A6B8VW98_9CORY|nr:hypothetical protein CKALI_11835 [Corynebacterium kalinowskii]